MSEVVLTATLPARPVSVNNLYQPQVWGKGKSRKTGITLTSDARKYKNEVSDVLKDQWLTEATNLNRFAFYRLSITIFVYQWSLFTKGFQEGRAKEPVKKMDSSNTIKVIEDAIAEAIGVDDKYNFDVICKKRPVLSKEEERVEVTLSEISLLELNNEQVGEDS